jgi:dihydrofolate synthase/folylpolyglutamate synthase
VPGRFETIRENPRVILDGANNPDGAQHLATQLGSTPRAPGAKLILILGILEDKDYAKMIEILAPLADVVIATRSPSPRAAAAETLAQKAREFCAHVEIRTPVTAALERALELAAENDIICVTGSFYTLAEVERNAFAKL